MPRAPLPVSAAVTESGAFDVSVGSDPSHTGLKRCAGPCRTQAHGGWKALESFHADTHSSDGKQSYCHTCRRAYDRARYQATRAANVARSLQWAREHPDAKAAHSRARRQRTAAGGAGLDRATRDAMIAWAGECMACGAREGLTVDHVIPLEEGGLDSPANGQVLCLGDNKRKKTQPTDYRPGWLRRRIKQGRDPGRPYWHDPRVLVRGRAPCRAPRRAPGRAPGHPTAPGRTGVRDTDEDDE